MGDSYAGRIYFFARVRAASDTVRQDANSVDGDGGRSSGLETKLTSAGDAAGGVRAPGWSGGTQGGVVIESVGTGTDKGGWPGPMRAIVRGRGYCWAKL